MHFSLVTEPPKSIKIIQNNAEVRQGAKITVVDGQVINDAVDRYGLTYQVGGELSFSIFEF